MAEQPCDVLNNQNEEVSKVEEEKQQQRGVAFFVHLPCRDQT